MRYPLTEIIRNIKIIIYVLGYDIELGEGEKTLYKEYEKI
mgnify:FL=1